MTSSAEFEAHPVEPTLDEIWRRYSDELFSMSPQAIGFEENYRFFVTATLAVIQSNLPPGVTWLSDIELADKLNHIIVERQAEAEEHNERGSVSILRKTSKEWHRYITGSIDARVTHRGQQPRTYADLMYGLEKGDCWFTNTLYHSSH